MRESRLPVGRNVVRSPGDAFQDRRPRTTMNRSALPREGRRQNRTQNHSREDPMTLLLSLGRRHRRPRPEPQRLRPQRGSGAEGGARAPGDGGTGHLAQGHGVRRVHRPFRSRRARRDPSARVRLHLLGQLHRGQRGAKGRRAVRHRPASLRGGTRQGTRAGSRRRARSLCWRSPSATGRRVCSVSTPSRRKSTTPAPPAASRRRPTSRRHRPPLTPRPSISPSRA